MSTSEYGHSGMPRDAARDLRREGLREAAGLNDKYGNPVKRFFDAHGDPIVETPPETSDESELDYHQEEIRAYLQKPWRAGP